MFIAVFMVDFVSIPLRWAVKGCRHHEMNESVDEFLTVVCGNGKVATLRSFVFSRED